jgi:hypothetical protein
MTVVSTITRHALEALITPARLAVSIVSTSSSSTPVYSVPTIQAVSDI